MQLIQQTPDLSAYLAADEAIDHHHPLVRETAAKLVDGVADSYEYARAAFEFVRDTIPHSQDSGDLRVTWRASDVLEQRTGICYAKAHALAALLRAEDIPTALCYQKFDVVHGLVAVRFNGAWHRQDPGATSRVSTPGSASTVSSWPSCPTRRPMNWTIQSCMLHRIRSCSTR